MFSYLFVKSIFLLEFFMEISYLLLMCLAECICLRYSRSVDRLFLELTDIFLLEATTLVAGIFFLALGAQPMSNIYNKIILNKVQKG